MLDSPAQRRREATRREILSAAWQLCREHGLTALSLREVAARVGMRAPSLYTYVDSKDAIYDLMFAQGQRELAEAMSPYAAADAPLDRDQIRAATRVFLDFCASDPTRYLLMFQRTIPGFQPSPASMALAVANLDLSRQQLAAAGVTDPRHLDLWTAVISGLAAQQLSNEPGSDRWLRLADETVDMYCNHVGILSDPNGASS